MESHLEPAEAPKNLPAEIAYAKMYGGREAVVEVLRQVLPRAEPLEEDYIQAVADFVMED